MQNEFLGSAQSAVHAMRLELREADDQKIERITAMVDEIADTVVNQTILDPLRARLGSLKPARPLRFSRLLFTPLDPLITPANKWKPGDAAVPRTVVASMSAVVRAGLGHEATVIDNIIAGQKAGALQVTSAAGEALWPHAAEILAVSTAPANWAETGLRPALYPTLAQAIAAVLRRATQLRSLSRDGDVAALETDHQTVHDILHNIANESAEGCGMIVQLMVLQSPHAIPILRQFASSRQTKADQTKLQTAMTGCMEVALTQMERQSGIIDEISHGPLAGVGDQVRRIIALVQELECDTGTSGHRPRLKAIRAKLDKTCQTRFAGGLSDGLVQPLTTALGQMDGAGQTRMEVCARDLRALETMARKVGGSGSYDDLLDQASKVVQAAAVAGTLTPIRKCRLIEILAGPEVATSVYRQERLSP